MADYKNMQADEFCRVLDDKDFFLLDTRAFQKEPLPGTDIYIPSSYIQFSLDKLPEDKATKIVVYCDYGVSSLRVCSFLAGQGYTEVYNVVGGANAYFNAI